MHMSNPDKPNICKRCGTIHLDPAISELINDHLFELIDNGQPAQPQANQGDDELDTIFGKHIKDLPDGSHTTTFTSCDYCRSALFAWKDRQLAERLQLVLAFQEVVHINDIGYVAWSELRDVITELMPKEAS